MAPDSPQGQDPKELLLTLVDAEADVVLRRLENVRDRATRLIGGFVISAALVAGLGDVASGPARPAFIALLICAGGVLVTAAALLIVKRWGVWNRGDDLPGRLALLTSVAERLDQPDPPSLDEVRQELIDARLETLKRARASIRRQMNWLRFSEAVLATFLAVLIGLAVWSASAQTQTVVLPDRPIDVRIIE
ncbi:MAG: hypothetical protein AB7I38_19520 [Dehalococcoidia bacterium]